MGEFCRLRVNHIENRIWVIVTISQGVAYLSAAEYHHTNTVIADYGPA